MKLSNLSVALAALSGMLQLGLCLPENDGTTAGPRAAQPRQITEIPAEDSVNPPMDNNAPAINFGHFRQLRQRLLEQRRQREQQDILPETRQPNPDDVPEEDSEHVREREHEALSDKDENDAKSVKELEDDIQRREDKATQTDDQTEKLNTLKEQTQRAETSNGEDEEPPIGWLIPARLRDPGYTLSIQAKAKDLIASSQPDIAQAIPSKSNALMEEAESRIEGMTTIDQVMNYFRDVDIFYDTLLEVYSMATYNIAEKHKLALSEEDTERLQNAVKEAYQAYLWWTTATVAPKINRILDARLQDIIDMPRQSHVEMLISGLDRYVAFIETMAGLFTLRDLFDFPLKAPPGIQNLEGLAGLLMGRQYLRIIEDLELDARKSADVLEEAKHALVQKLEFQIWNKPEYDFAMAMLDDIAKSPSISNTATHELQQARMLFRRSWAETEDYFFYRALKKFKKIAKYEALLPDYTSFNAENARGAWGTIISFTEQEAHLFSLIQTQFDKEILRAPGGEEILKKIYKDHDEVLF